MSEYRIQGETLEGIADAIREKTGDSALIAPEDMATEIASISGGDSYEMLDKYTAGTLSHYRNTEVTTLRTNAFYGSRIETYDFPNLTEFDGQGHFANSNIKHAFFPNAPLRAMTFQQSSIETAVVKNTLSWVANCFYNASYLTHLDMLYSTYFPGGGRGMRSISVIVLRKADALVILSNANGLGDTGNAFASGGTGGTIYIPKVLYDHLGDGSALDYKSATNWSTIDGYGTITWAQIEGSQYENHYADGTVIE